MGSFQFEKKKSPGRPFLTVNASKRSERSKSEAPDALKRVNQCRVYDTIFKDTSKRFQNLKKDKISLKEIIFQMDNAIPHTAAATQNFRASWNVSLVKQSPYSSDLNFLNSFLCRQVKSDLRGKIIAAQIT